MQLGSICPQPMPLQEAVVVVVADAVPSISSRIADQAQRTPNQIAVTDENSRLTFAELEGRSNQLAWTLIQAGVKTDCCFGLFFDRSTDFVVAALAVLKTGAAYLAMDSSTPADRAASMLKDAAAAAVLTHRQKTHGWSETPCAGDRDRRSLDQRRKCRCSSSPTSTVWPISSTRRVRPGRPKGVEITHRNLLNLIDWHQSAFGVTAADRASQVAGLGFDATAWEIWPHLTAGASVHFADEVTRRSPHGLRDWLVAERITIGFVPTVLAEQLLHAEWPADTSLRTLLTGADVLHRRPVAGLPFTVVNNYGPSECTVVATSGMIVPDDSASAAPSIGRPIQAQRCYLLDENLRPVKRGEAGELCLAGTLVGRGYRNQPELTASRFVTYSPATGAGPCASIGPATEPAGCPAARSPSWAGSTSK